ncbi:beta-mannosidase [Sphingomonas sp.]|uniref:beta-mannosidase n=1 Tax=Sphingomonas sp. TaxID=28214 RepID=UPI002EDBA2E6
MLFHRLLLGLGLSLMPVLAAAQAPTAPAVRLLDHGWQVRLDPAHPKATDHRAATRWLSATVPGTVQTDLLAKGLIADPWRGEGERAAQWVGLSNWQYRQQLDLDAAWLARGNIDLVFEGLDTFATISINGVVAGRADNMFRTWRIPAKSLLKPGRNTVEVDFESPITRLQPMVMALKTPLPGAYDSAFGDEPKGRQTANYVRKAAYHYGWDFTPRLVAIGIWKPVRLEAYDSVRLADLHVDQIHLDDEAAVLDAVVEVVATAPQPVEVKVDITAPDSAIQTISRRVTLFAGTNPITLPARIERPQRWWPVGYGRPDLYTVTATIVADGREIGRTTHDIGLRTVELRRERDRWGRSMAFVVNGVPIFAKGANLEPADSFGSRVPAARTDAVLEAAMAANMNMLRIWGGGYYPDDALYRKADRLGLMLWQDFMFGNAIPTDDPAYHENTRLEAVDQVRRLRDHPSLVMWVGNNEVQTGWENWGDRKAFKASMTPDQQEAFGASIRRLFDKDLRAVVARYSPATPYFGGSPTTDYDGPSEQMTDGDVHYWDVWARSPLENYLTTTPRFMSEFGLQSMPDMRTVRSFLAPVRPEDMPVQISGSAYDSGKGNGRILGYLRADYGEPRSFVDYVYLSQLYQAEGLEMAVLHQRAARPQTMGTLYWTLNDTWPGLINSVWAGQAWGSIDFHNRWKASHYRARRFYAPVTIGAERVAGTTRLTLISDRRAAWPARWRLRVVDRDGRLRSDRSGQVSAAPLAATPLAALADADLLQGADPARSVAIAELIENDAVVARKFVYFAKAKDLALVDPQLSGTVSPAAGGGYRLTVSARSLARGVWIDFAGLGATLSDNAFDLAGGDTATIHVTTTASLPMLRKALTLRSLFGATLPRK